MRTVGIICEYNPLHKGHEKQLKLARQLGAEGIVCLMSGNYVQRGAPAIIDKSLRAAAAVECGADLVLELPVTACLSSAEGFAREGVRLLGGFCNELCFGAEIADERLLMATAQALRSEAFSPALAAQLEQGLSFPRARAAALEQMGLDASLLNTPNNILAVEYCKAILELGVLMKPLAIHRGGSYHDQQADAQNPSATAVRRQITQGLDWKVLVPQAACSFFEDASIHTPEAGERAVLARLKTMTDAEFEALPFGSEGLWRKLMHESRRRFRVEDIATAVKSKRYTRTRIDRMILCAFLGLTNQDLAAPAPYARVLAFNRQGREILKNARLQGMYPNIADKTGHPYEITENRAEALYGLFCVDAPQASAKRRIYYSKEN